MGVEHVVSLGETLRTIAMSYGIGDWRSIYNHARNAEFRRARPDPEILHPGDRVWVEQPGNAPVVYGGAAVPCRTGRSYVFTAPPMVPLNVRLVDRSGDTIANRRYDLRAGAYRSEGRSDGDGYVRDEVPLDATTAEIGVFLYDDDREPSWRVVVNLNAVHPLSTIEGIQSRLGNLGYWEGPIDGSESPTLRQAIERFQRARGIRVTGAIDDALRQALRELHPS